MQEKGLTCSSCHRLMYQYWELLRIWLGSLRKNYQIISIISLEKDGAAGLAEQMNIGVLGQIPLVQSIREAGDCGRPAILQETTPTAKYFKELVDKVIDRVDYRK